MNNLDKERLNISNILTTKDLRDNALTPEDYICDVTILCSAPLVSCNTCPLGTTKIKDTLYDPDSHNRELALEAVLTTIILN